MINQQSPFIQKPQSVTSIMLMVLVALIPAIIVNTYYYGIGVILNILLASITALLAEFIILKIRKMNVYSSLTDGSALVAAWLLALSVPSISPWWIIFVGTLFTIVIAKHFYGGLGSNLFNPAMIGYAVLLISFPSIMTKWPAASGISTQQSLNLFLSGITLVTDGITSATPLDYIKTELMQGRTLEAIKNSASISLSSAHVYYVALAYFLGGILLLYKKIITWHLPVAFLASLIIISSLFVLTNSNIFSGPVFHVFNGGVMLCAFFIITDPVSGPTTPKGKMVFAFLAALIILLIRNFGGYPEGVAFAVIFLNICAPLIDTLTQPKVFGHE